MRKKFTFFSKGSQMSQFGREKLGSGYLSLNYIKSNTIEITLYEGRLNLCLLHKLDCYLDSLDGK